MVNKNGVSLSEFLAQLKIVNVKIVELDRWTSRELAPHPWS